MGSLQSSFTIGQLMSGYRNFADVFVDSLTVDGTGCIPHVQCYPWHLNSARAVARISIPTSSTTTSQCTGTLINNELNNGRAYLLTAFHCVDHNNNNQIDAPEIDAVRNAVFQFQFWRQQCSASSGTLIGIQFNGAEIRSSNRGSDMVLLELINQPGIGDLVNYAGWSRQSTSSSNSQSYIIHHPEGNNMRHTQTSNVRTYLFNDNYWQAYYSSGVVSPGSSGSALFNEYGQIIGQLKGGWSSCNFTDFSDRYGKFNRSWSNSNMSTWLSPTQNLQSVPSLNLAPVEIQGLSTVSCESFNQYWVPGGLDGCTYTWTVSNNLQIVSGQSTASINVIGVSNSTNTTATITCTLNTPTKGRIRTLVVSKTVVLSLGSVSGYYTTGGTTNQNLLNVDNVGDNFVNAGMSYVTITSNDILSQNWSLHSGNPVSWQYNTMTNNLEMNMPLNGYALFTLDAETTCGDTQFEFLFYSGDSYYRLSPNPGKDLITLAVDEDKIIRQKIIKSSDQDIREIVIVNGVGNIVQRKMFGRGIRSTQMLVSGLFKGIYTVRIFNGKTWSSLRLIKE